MIASKYGKGLGLLIFCLTFVMMVSGAAAAPVNISHITINQSSNQITTELKHIEN